MFDPADLVQLRRRMQQRAESDRRLLDALCAEVRNLRPSVRQILPRSATTMSIVAADGGNNSVQFDPFAMHVVRVVDSYGQQLYLDVVSPEADIREVNARHFQGGQPTTALGRMIAALGKANLWDVSTSIPSPDEQGNPERRSSWVLPYRDLCEWAVLHERICNTEYSTDTLIVRDGLLRSKIFVGRLFLDLIELLEDGIRRARSERRRRIYLVGVSKQNAVITRYRLAMGLESIMNEPFPCYVRVPSSLEEQAYVWREYAVRRGEERAGGEVAKYVAGALYLVKFGRQPRDPIWAVDVLDSQLKDDTTVLGHLLADALDGFPMPLFPRSLQRAHDNAMIVDFDMDIIENEAFRAIRAILPKGKSDVLDGLRLQGDPSAARYL